MGDDYTVRTVRRGAPREPVTVAFHRRARPGSERGLEDVVRRSLHLSSTFPGQLGAEVLRAPGGSELTVLYRFEDARALEGWLESDVRLALLREAEPLTERAEPVQRRTGLETWFAAPGGDVPTMRPPPRWKMWLVSLLAAYPLVLAFQGLLGPWLEDIPLALRSFLLPLTLLSLMTYGIMPLVTRALRRWLGPP